MFFSRAHMNKVRSVYLYENAANFLSMNTISFPDIKVRKKTEVRVIKHEIQSQTGIWHYPGITLQIFNFCSLSDNHNLPSLKIQICDLTAVNFSSLITRGSSTADDSA